MDDTKKRAHESLRRTPLISVVAREIKLTAGQAEAACPCRRRDMSAVAVEVLWGRWALPLLDVSARPDCLERQKARRLEEQKQRCRQEQPCGDQEFAQCLSLELSTPYDATEAVDEEAEISTMTQATYDMYWMA
eukprot:CAMPEP_0205908328 /NCGR_PEP_ID=MMETSP1325-20131115/3141_1 /ASSEMBLY_ACC=CAM_ASM_000708 /TAXON_ID=236786 /ORGANISM="Florenciella sp., Strain RCC1007" /LENGTH=133 /DNA_ID=CAMNT_0053274513 /DNA_START=53 /DNA_END=456 /DNA_ORIENTATION=-